MRLLPLLVLLAAAAAPRAAERPPNPAAGGVNIVLLVADDLGYGELGCQGNPQIPTPHIDSIAASGVRFTAGYVTAPYCSASRAGLLTGRYQTRFGYEFNPIGAHNEHPRAGLPPETLTLAELLKDRAGYTTALIGKWHLGGHPTFHPIRNGFDTFFGFSHEGHYFVPPPWDGVTTMLRRKTLPGGGKGRWTRGDGRLVYSTHMGHNEPAYDANNPIVRDGQPVVEKAYLTDAFTREATAFIERNRDAPFFLYLAYNAVHSPLQGAEAYLRRFAHIEDVHRRIFAAMLANLDDSVGAVLATLRETGLEENTLVFFLSDNGGPTRELTSSNRPLRGGKGTVYEGGLRVPFLARWTGRLPAGRVVSAPVLSLDIYATAAAAAGVETPPVDGVDLLPFLRGEAEALPPRSLYWRIQHRRALRLGAWKILRQDRRGDWELYHLEEDIGETRDRAAEYEGKRDELVRAWEALDREMTDPVWSPR